MLQTPSLAAPFTIARIDDGGVTMLFGREQTSTRLTWPMWEGALDFVNGEGWVEIGGSFSAETSAGTLDSYLKGHVRRATAGWVASVLEAAGVAEIDRGRPARLRTPSPTP